MTPDTFVLTPRDFISTEQAEVKYREGSGSGSIKNWIDFDEYRLLTDEHYFAIPHSGTVWTMITADENELKECDNH